MAEASRPDLQNSARGDGAHRAAAIDKGHVTADAAHPELEDVCRHDGLDRGDEGLLRERKPFEHVRDGGRQLQQQRAGQRRGGGKGRRLEAAAAASRAAAAASTRSRVQAGIAAAA